MELPDNPDPAPFQAHYGAAAGVAGRMAPREEFERQAPRQGLHGAFGIEDIDGLVPLPPLLGKPRPEGEAGDALGLDREAGLRALEAAADLEKAGAGVAPVQVRAQT